MVTTLGPTRSTRSAKPVADGAAGGGDALVVAAVEGGGAAEVGEFCCAFCPHPATVNTAIATTAIHPDFIGSDYK
ncbi:hypothetical protein MDUV_46760 [Mycolicibacterium duvalii]|uniref:Uncharacterized protein n=1 Tax=Mycolicibacterium duvalii TaxID=39688 RepID=A0A7I7K6U0_9MYCO|nr:hypothetical protein MDUV_46760 [Mycolicibacterium duvalii]